MAIGKAETVCRLTEPATLNVAEEDFTVSSNQARHTCPTNDPPVSELFKDALPEAARNASVAPGPHHEITAS